MGMFDTVHFTCPNCKEKITEQTKSGKCNLEDYHQSYVPIEAASGLLGLTVRCNNCDKEYIINGNVTRIPLSLVEIEVDGDTYD